MSAVALPIPSSIAEVTAGWLAEVTGLDVRSIRAEQIGQGIGVTSALYRLHLEGSGCPSSVVVKLPALDEAAVFTSTILRMYIREVRFFAELAADAPVRVPASYHGEVDEASSRFVVVMEDMGSMRTVDQIAGMDVADAEHAVDELAAWHARWWGRADALAASGTTVSLGDPMYPALLPMVFAEGWEKVTGAMHVPAPILAVGERYAGAIEGLLRDLSEAPTTMLHGDYRADNMLFDADGRVALLDFQLIGTGRGVYDLAYFVTQSLSAETAADQEAALFERWISGLREAGVAAGDLSGAWEDYRKAALFCLVYPIVASRGMDLTDPRQHDLVACMIDRFARAVEDLELTMLL